MPVFWRKVGPAKKGLQIGREPDAHRPSAAPSQPLHIAHVETVHIGTFLAVDLHIDKVLVHQGGDLGILEGLVRHDVAPVAGGIADREKDRFLLSARPLKCLLTPRIPLHWITRMLKQVGRSAGGEVIHCKGF